MIVGRNILANHEKQKKVCGSVLLVCVMFVLSRYVIVCASLLQVFQFYLHRGNIQLLFAFTMCIHNVSAWSNITQSDFMFWRTHF